MKAGADVWASLLPLLDESTRQDLVCASMDEAAAVISFLGIHSVQEWQALPNDRKQLYVPTNAAGVLQSSGSNWRHALSSWLLADLTDGWRAPGIRTWKAWSQLRGCYGTGSTLTWSPSRVAAGLRLGPPASGSQTTAQHSRATCCQPPSRQHQQSSPKS